MLTQGQTTWYEASTIYSNNININDNNTMESFLEEMSDASPNNCELRRMEGSWEEELVKFVKDKKCSNGDRFTGFVDVVTGELVSGKRIYMATQECYEGPFLHGDRHGFGVCTKLNGQGKFMGNFQYDSYEQGTLIANTYTYSGLFSGGTYHGLGTLVHSDGSLYEGTFDEGVFAGHGKLVNSEGDLYEGGFRDGKKHGHGKMTYIDGSAYIGDWSHDCKDGVGKYTYAGNREYEGEFVNDQRHGKGTLTTPSAIVAGPWRNDKPLDGPGWTIRYPKAGVNYVGDALACRPHGRGELSFRDQDANSIVYEGELLCGLRHGYGRQYARETGEAMSYKCERMRARSASDGDEEYVTWKGDLMMPSTSDDEERPETSPELERETDDSSTPELTELDLSESDESRASPRPPQVSSDESEDGDDIKVYPNGDTFRGHTDVFGQRQGFGIFSEAATGMCISCHWKSSKKHGKGTVNQPLSGVEYVGNFVEDIMEGQGSIRYRDGSKFSGKLVDGMLHGKGTFHDEINETVYVGDFFHSLKHGQGEEEYADGSVYVGPFVNGIRSGDDGCLYRKTPGGRLLLYQGQWVDNIMTGNGKRYELSSPCAGFYFGEMQGGKRHGRGTFCTNDRHKYEGNWVDDAACDGDWMIVNPRVSIYYGSALCKYGIPVPDGLGTQHDGDGTFYCGSFRMGQRHGHGMCIFSSGVQWDGRWEDGIYVKYRRSRP